MLTDTLIIFMNGMINYESWIMNNVDYSLQ